MTPSASPDDVHALLREQRIGQLATADRTGAPHLVPLCFVYDGQTIYSALDHKPKRRTGYAMKRIQNILENPQVAFLIQHYEEDWQRLYYVMVRGTATVLEDGAERQRACELLEAKYAQYRARQLSVQGGLVIKITPVKIHHWRWPQAIAALPDALH